MAFLQADLPPIGAGGVAYQVALLAREMSSRHEVTVYTTVSADPKEPFEVVQCVPAGHGAVSKVLGVGLAFGRLDLRHHDVVHAHGDSWAVKHPRQVRTFYGTAAAEALSATSWKRRIGQTVHYGLELVACARAEIRTTIGEHAKRFLPRVDEVIPCGVDPSVFFPSRDRFQQPTILFVAGHLGGRKRGSLALQAFKSVRERVPAARMIIVSRDFVREPGVESHSGLSSDQIGALFRSSWVLCSTSSYEGFGVPYAEALVSGLPIVTTNNPGARDVLGSGGGVIVDEDKIVDTLVSHLQIPPTPDEAFVDSMTQKYGIKHIADQYESLYGHLAHP